MTNETLDKMWNILKENNFQIDDLIKSEFICTSCKNIVIKPCNVPCGCRYCYDCLVNYLNGEDKFCLGESEYCKSELISFDNNFSFDHAANIKISRIVVKCPLESCEFKTELGKMANHMGTCDRGPMSCPYHTLGCDDKKLGVDKMEQHFKQENYCHAKLLMDFVDNWKNEMKLLKSNILELKEENKWIKEQMESKQTTILALEENVAKLLQENRSVQEPETAKSHENNEVRKSIERISWENTSLREELEIINLDNKAKETKSEEEKQEIGKVKKKCELIEDNQKKIKTQLKEFVKINNSLREELKMMKQDKTKQEDRINKISCENTAITTKFKERENIIEIIETKLSHIQAFPNCGEFLWCIENWAEKKIRAVNGSSDLWYSSPFYSHKNGYKMCLQLSYSGISWQTFFNMGFCIMKGEFDNSLQWPFQHGVKLDLLNEETGISYFSKILEFKNSPTSNACNKPTTRRNVSFSIVFLNLCDVFCNTVLIKNNQLLIKATLMMKA